jgi:hypothetical protein
MKKVFLAIAVLVLVSMACSAVGGANLPGVPTTAPQNPTSEILYQDDFSDTNSGWPINVDTDKSASYSDGQYLLQSFPAKQDVWAHPGEFFSDVRVEVDATKSLGPDNNDFGVVCRFVDDDNFYFFIISSDGYQAIGKYQAGEFSYLSSDQMESTSGINPGASLNKVRADCIGSTLTLYANGQQLSSVTDTSFATGDVGLIVGTFEDPNVGILFDNFVVYKP